MLKRGLPPVGIWVAVKYATSNAYAVAVFGQFGLLIIILVGTLLAIGLPLLHAKWLRDPAESIFPLRPRSAPLPTATVIGLGVAAAVAGWKYLPRVQDALVGVSPFIWVRAFTDAFIFAKVETPVLAYPVIITFVILPAVFEEALYRGYLGHICASLLPKGIAPFTIAVLFAIAHGRPEAFLALVVLSLILSASVVLTRSILPAMAIHALSNSALLFFPALIH